MNLKFSTSLSLSPELLYVTAGPSGLCAVFGRIWLPTDCGSNFRPFSGLAGRILLPGRWTVESFLFTLLYCEQYSRQSNVTTAPKQKLRHVPMYFRVTGCGLTGNISITLTGIHSTVDRATFAFTWGKMVSIVVLVFCAAFQWVHKSHILSLDCLAGGWSNTNCGSSYPFFCVRRRSC